MNDAQKNAMVVNNPASDIVPMDYEMLALGGMGTEHVKASNLLIPRLTILQALSPQLNKKKAEFVEGAEVGDFCNTATGDIYKEVVTIIPCYFITNYLEWKKGRSGLAFNYGDDPSILEKAVRNEKNQNTLPNGNSVEETAQWYCLLQSGASWERIFFPLKSTNLKHSRKWMTLCRAETLKTEQGLWKPPLFWRSWMLKIVDDSNDQGDWATFKPEKSETIIEIDPSHELLKTCKAFYEDVKTERVKGDIESSQDEQSGPSKGENISDKNIPF